jgi:hypothetical protein
MDVCLFGPFAIVTHPHDCADLFQQIGVLHCFPHVTVV